MSPSSTASCALCGFCFRPSRTICSAGCWTIGRETRFGPTRPRLFEQRRTPRGLLEMRRGAIGALQAHERSGEIQVSLEALDAAADQCLERARRRRVVAPVQRQNPFSHAFVGPPELEDLVLRIGARRGRRGRAADVAEGAEPFEQTGRQRFGPWPSFRCGVPGRASSPASLEGPRLAPAALRRGCAARADPPPGRRARASGPARTSTIHAGGLADRSIRNGAAAPATRHTAGCRASAPPRRGARRRG